MKKSLMVLVVGVLALSFSSMVLAADIPRGTVPEPAVKGATPVRDEPTAKSPTYPAGPIQKAERGFMNAVFGWTEIPKKVVDKTQETNNPFIGLVVGGWQGCCKAFARTASGASELITFPIGRYDKPMVLPDMPAVEK